VIYSIVVPIDTRAEDYRLACITFYLQVVFPKIGFTLKYINLLLIFALNKLRIKIFLTLLGYGGGFVALNL
jgi:hypothetical protein